MAKKQQARNGLKLDPRIRKALPAVVVGIIIGGAGTALTFSSFAAPPNKGGGTINGPVMISDANGDGKANFGDTITFNVTGSASSAAGPWADLFCYQNGQFVFSQTAGFGSAYPWDPYYTMSSAYWTSGGADCSATLYTTDKRGRHQNMATLQFTVAP